MSENRPYMQDNNWDDLPLPGQDESWKKMEALLDKEEKRRILPPFFLNCAGIGLFSAIVIAAAWFAFKPGGFLNEKQVAKTEKKATASQTGNTKASATDPSTNPASKNNSNTSGASIKNTSVGSARSTTELKNKTSEENPKPVDRNQIISARNSSPRTPVKSGRKEISSSDLGPDHSTAKTRKRKIEDVMPAIQMTNPEISNKPDRDTKDSVTKTATAVISTEAPMQVPPGLIVNPALADTNQTPTTDAREKEVKNKKPQRFSFSAGIGIQQQLRNGTQYAYNSDYYGNKGLISEHIPSVYFRVHHKENWFVQAEFRFGAPQLVKDYSYARKIRYDTGASNLVVSTMRLRKLYYHQLPFSFNYNVLPRLSIGAGGVYSIFYRAVTEQEVKSTNIYTGAESFSKITQQIPGFRDSFFFKSQVQFILHTDYRWKNFSIGLRYKKDLQPYIRYTKPDGRVDQDMNDAMEIILRYRLWKSKK
jgi:hypothetical protein